MYFWSLIDEPHYDWHDKKTVSIVNRYQASSSIFPSDKHRYVCYFNNLFVLFTKLRAKCADAEQRYTPASESQRRKWSSSLATSDRSGVNVDLVLTRKGVDDTSAIAAAGLTPHLLNPLAHAALKRTLDTHI